MLKVDKIEMLLHVFQVIGHTCEYNAQDKEYLIPASEWVESKLFPFCREVFINLNAYMWKKNNDCDDKANGFKWLAGVCHGQLQEKTAPEGIAVGMIEYKTDKGGYHAVNIVVCNNDMEVRFIEPQRMSWLNLSEKEVASIQYLNF